MTNTKQIDINTLSVVELKALAYDTVATIQNLNNNLQLINKKIEEKMSQPTSEPVEAVDKV